MTWVKAESFPDDVSHDLCGYYHGRGRDLMDMYKKTILICGVKGVKV